MHFYHHMALALSLGMALLGLAMPYSAKAQDVWSGYTFTFNHPASSSVADEITPNAILNRSTSRGIYNEAYESAYQDDYSPEFTLWATEFNNPEVEVSATNWENLEFTDWRNAYGSVNNLANEIVNTKAVVYLTLDDVYLDLRFTNWGVGFGGGGAFTYERAIPPTIGPTGDYNGDGTVDAADYTVWRDTFGQTVTSPGSGADGDESGEIDLPDYQFWKDHFGEVVSGAGASSVAVPEPTTSALVIGSLFVLGAGRQLATRRPA